MILTSLPSIGSGCSHARHSKRQYADSLEEDSGSLSASALAELEEIEELIEDYMSTTSLWDTAAAPSGNGTSIFSPKENSGLFHRYVFFTPGLILCFIISFLVLTPIAIVGTKTLGTIHTLAGLETKMTGSVGGEASKPAQ